MEGLGFSVLGVQVSGVLRVWVCGFGVVAILGFRICGVGFGTRRKATADNPVRSPSRRHDPKTHQAPNLQPKSVFPRMNVSWLEERRSFQRFGVVRSWGLGVWV